jgi:hypothetical protein
MQDQKERRFADDMNPLLTFFIAITGGAIFAIFAKVSDDTKFISLVTVALAIFVGFWTLYSRSKKRREREPKLRLNPGISGGVAFIEVEYVGGTDPVSLIGNDILCEQNETKMIQHFGFRAQGKIEKTPVLSPANPTHTYLLGSAILMKDSKIIGCSMSSMDDKTYYCPNYPEIHRPKKVRTKLRIWNFRRKQSKKYKPV